MEKIALSPSNVEKRTASHCGVDFTYEVKVLPIKKQSEYEDLVDEAVKKEETLIQVLIAKWNFIISNCSIKKPFDTLALNDITIVLKDAEKVISGVAEKKP